MNGHDDAEALARRHFEALQQAGLTSWTFAEFFAFCAPHAQHATAAPAIEVANCAAARELADAISELMQARHGQPLDRKSRSRIIHAAQHTLVARNRRRLHLVQSPR